MKTNENGLTWRQWFAAATFGHRETLSLTDQRWMRDAWRAGECPCDWAAALTEGEGCLLRMI